MAREKILKGCNACPSHSRSIAPLSERATRRRCGRCKGVTTWGELSEAERAEYIERQRKLNETAAWLLAND